MKKRRMYSAAIFDLDGLMLDTEGISRSAWKRAMADFGFVLTDDIYYEIVGLTIRDIEGAFRSAFGKDFPLPQVSRRRLQYLSEHIAQHGIAVKPGLVELLAFLDKAKFRKAVATSSCRDLAIRKLTVSGLIDKFGAIVCGDDVPNGKPAPDVFLAAAEQLQTSPQRCLVFEDSDNGVQAAHKAGMTIIVVPDVKQPSDEAARLAHKVFSSLHEAIPFLQQFINTPA